MKHFVLFRETSAQHFNTPTGEFLKGKSDVNKVNKIGFPSTVAARSELLGKLQEDIDFFYPASLKSSFDYSCFPLSNTTMMQAQNWKNVIVQSVMKRLTAHHAIFSHHSRKARSSHFQLSRLLALGECPSFMDASLEKLLLYLR